LIVNVGKEFNEYVILTIGEIFLSDEFVHQEFNNAAEFVFFNEPVKHEFYRPPSRSQSVEEVA